jgi:hypothetical protein
VVDESPLRMSHCGRVEVDDHWITVVLCSVPDPWDFDTDPALDISQVRKRTCFNMKYHYWYRNYLMPLNGKYNIFETIFVNFLNNV